MAYFGVVLLVFSQASLFSLTVKKKLTVNGSYKMLPNLAVRRRMSVRRSLLMFGANFFQTNRTCFSRQGHGGRLPLIAFPSWYFGSCCVPSPFIMWITVIKGVALFPFHLLWHNYTDVWMGFEVPWREPCFLICKSVHENTRTQPKVLFLKSLSSYQH